MLGGDVDAVSRSVHFNLLLDRRNAKDEVQLQALADGERDAGALPAVAKPSWLTETEYAPDGQRRRIEASIGVSGEAAGRAGFNLTHGHGCAIETMRQLLHARCR